MNTLYATTFACILQASVAHVLQPDAALFDEPDGYLFYMQMQASVETWDIPAPEELLLVDSSDFLFHMQLKASMEERTTKALGSRYGANTKGGDCNGNVDCDLGGHGAHVHRTKSSMMDDMLRDQVRNTVAAGEAEEKHHGGRASLKERNMAAIVVGPTATQRRVDKHEFGAEAHPDCDGQVDCDIDVRVHRRKHRHTSMEV